MSKKKRKRNRNPLLQQKFDEGYALGLQHGIENATLFFEEKFEGLHEVDGIGEKTIEKFIKHFGEKYFEKVKK